MNSEGKRFNKALGLALAIHLFCAGLLGGLVYLPIMNKDSKIIEVSLAGAPKKKVAKAAKPQAKPKTKQVIKTRPDDIVDKRIKEVLPKPEQEVENIEESVDTTQESSAEGESSNTENTAEGAVGNGSGNVEAGTPVQLPYVTYKVDPAYPGEARKNGVQGTVFLKVLVETNGRAVEAMISRSSGSSALDQSALNAIYKWHFSPARDTRGQKVRCYVNVPVQFRLR